MIRQRSFAITPMLLVDGDYRAKWLVPVTSPPIENGMLSVIDGRIAKIGSADTDGHPTDRAIVDLGDVAVLPGLVNAHTHLEFSDLTQPIGDRNLRFPDWILEVIRYRRQRDSAPSDAEERRRAATSRGLKESMGAQTSALGEIATPGWAETLFDRSLKMDVTIFLEILGLDKSRTNALLVLAADHIRTGKKADKSWRAGLSPHAPYTVRPELVQDVARLSKLARIPVAMHLAETRDELELLELGTGPLVDFLRGLGAWDDSAIERGTTPMHYLGYLSEAHRALVIHGNYLTSDEIVFLGRNRERMSVVYCPRTCEHFGHRPYPLAEMLQAGVCVAVGTDSRASNPNLNLFEELKAIHRLHPHVSATDILKMGTKNGASALELDRGWGDFAIGGLPHVTLVTTSDRFRSRESRDNATGESLHRFLLESGDICVGSPGIDS